MHAPVNLVLLGLLLVVLLRAACRELARRRRVEWRRQILELLAAAVRRGCPPVPLLERAAAGDGPLAATCGRLAERLDLGVPLSQALEQVAADWFPPACLAAIAGTEGSGALAAALDDLAVRADEQGAMAWRLRTQLTYPAVLAVGLVVVHFTALRVRGWLDPQFVHAGRQPVWPGWVLVGTAVLAAVWLQTLLQEDRPLGRRLRGFARRVGSRTEAFRLRAAGEFLGALSHAVAGGTALPAAIRRTAAAAGDEQLAAELGRAADRFEEGWDAESAWRTTWLPEFALAAAAAVARPAAPAPAQTLYRAAAESHRRWQRIQERRLALLPVLAVAAAGVVLALECALLFAAHYETTRAVGLW